MLSTFVCISPILNKKSEQPSTFRSNILLNTGLFKSYNEYLFGSTALTVDGVSRILKMNCLAEEPDVWDDFIRWNFDHERNNTNCASNVHEKPVRLSEFKTWIHRLFLKTVIPPSRQSHAACREEHPNSVSMILWLLKFCIEKLGYPVHWVTSTIESLLVVAPAGSTLKTKALNMNKSPSPILPEGKKLNLYNISAFQLDLRNQLGIFVQCGFLPSQLLLTQSQLLPMGKIVKCSLNIKLSSITGHGNQGVSCTGFFLEKKKNFGYVIQESFGSVMDMMEMFSGSGGNGGGGRSKGPRPSVDLRESLLQYGDDIGHLFSTASYNLKEEILSFHMCEDIFYLYKDYAVSIVRTDCWGTVDHNIVYLKDAQLEPLDY